MSIVEEGGRAFDPLMVKRAGYGMVVAGIMGGVTLFVWRKPAICVLDIALVVASVAIALLAPQLFEVRSRRGARGFNPLFIAPAGLLMFAGLDNQFVDRLPELIGAVAGAAALGALAALRMVVPGVSSRSQFVVVLALIGAGIGLGAPMVTDVAFDASAPQAIRTTVSAMYVTHGKSTTYNLRLPAWGARSSPNEVAISSSLYNQLDPGDPVCIDLHAGALAIPWFVLHGCPVR